MRNYTRLITIFFLTLTGSYYSRAQITVTTQQTFSSPNAKTTPGLSYKNMLYLDYGSLFTLSPDLTGGIIGNIAGGGQIKLSVYAYNDSLPDGKGALVYGVYINATSLSYNGTPSTNVYIDAFTDDFGHGYPVYAGSNNIKELIKAGNVYIPNGAGNADCKTYAYGEDTRSPWNLFYNTIAAFAGSLDFINKPLPPKCVEFFQAQQPVVVEVTMNNATLNSLKIPGMGIYNPNGLFGGAKPIAAIGGKVTLCSHRGDWQDVNAPENTRNAVRDMINENYGMVELDLWNTADNQVIVFHDMGLNKRTVLTGSVKAKNWSDLQNQYIKNRFDEVITSPDTKIALLGDMLDYINQLDPTGHIYINLDRSANDIGFFKQVYQLVDGKNMLDHAIFKGRFNPDPDNGGQIAPTAATIKQAFVDMYPNATQAERDNRMKLMYYTPILFDNNLTATTTNDSTFATRMKGYIDDMINAGIADGFELNFKSYPVGSPSYANTNNSNVFLLKQWAVLGDPSGTPATRNFVEYVHSRGLPVGIFASVPEVCAIPDFKVVNNQVIRDTTSLVSGFVKEDLNNGFVPKVQDQGAFDFRGDYEFYIGAGVDFVISDRPDVLREYLKAIGRF